MYTITCHRIVTRLEEFHDMFSEATQGVETLASWEKASPMIINAGACEMISEMSQRYDDPVNGVVVDLPTILIHSVSDSYDIGVAMAGAKNDGANYGHITQLNNVMAILGGRVEIAAH